jgi:hypothetical protein
MYEFGRHLWRFKRGLQRYHVVVYRHLAGIGAEGKG